MGHSEETDHREPITGSPKMAQALEETGKGAQKEGTQKVQRRGSARGEFPFYFCHSQVRKKSRLLWNQGLDGDIQAAPILSKSTD